jgi:hypothetical protein
LSTCPHISKEEDSVLLAEYN